MTNDGYAVSLSRGRSTERCLTRKQQGWALIRVVDESGERPTSIRKTTSNSLICPCESQRVRSSVEPASPAQRPGAQLRVPLAMSLAFHVALLSRAAAVTELRASSSIGFARSGRSC